MTQVTTSGRGGDSAACRRATGFAPPSPRSGGSVKRLLVLGTVVTAAATTGLGTTALAAPSPSGVTHRNVHVCATPSKAGVAACHAIRHDRLDGNGKPVSPNASSPTGYGPSDIHAA